MTSTIVHDPFPEYTPTISVVLLHLALEPMNRPMAALQWQWQCNFRVSRWYNENPWRRRRRWFCFFFIYIISGGGAGREGGHDGSNLTTASRRRGLKSRDRAGWDAMRMEPIAVYSGTYVIGDCHVTKKFWHRECAILENPTGTYIREAEPHGAKVGLCRRIQEGRYCTFKRPKKSWGWCGCEHLICYSFSE
jgi:hypothetical protein